MPQVRLIVYICCMNDNSTSLEIANEIFHHFELNQSCTIRGFALLKEKEGVIPKGEMVCRFLEELDVAHNFTRVSGRVKPRRKRVKLDDTIGGFVAQKIFRFKKEQRGDEIIYKIWRIQ